MFKVGDVEIRRVEELIVPFEMSFLTKDAQFVKDNESWLVPHFYDPTTKNFNLVFQSWILSTAKGNILIDPCNGNGRSRPLAEMFNNLNTPYIERFEASGVSADEIDMVFCTHLHCDHCGWNTRMRDGKWVPTFPNARYIFVQREFDRWDPRRPDFKPDPRFGTMYEDSILPVLDAGLVDFRASPSILVEGVSIEPAYGHTAGHSVLRIDTGAQEVYFTGDTFYHPLEVVRPSIMIEGSMEDADVALNTRICLRRTIAERNALMIPAHFPAPYAGTVHQKDAEFEFRAYSGTTAAEASSHLPLTVSAV